MPNRRQPRYAPRPCDHCGLVMQPTSGRQNCHPECALVVRRRYFRAYHRRGTGPRRQPIVARREALDDLKRFVATYHRVPTAREIRRQFRLPCYRTIRALFGSVTAWLAAAGLTPRPCGVRLSASRPPTPLPSRPLTLTPTRPRAPRRFIYHPDFLLALPELRAELARAEAQATTHTGRARRSA